MHELLKILKDVKSGALPVTEIPKFILWVAKKNFVGLWLAAIAAGLVFWRRRRR